MTSTVSRGFAVACWFVLALAGATTAFGNVVEYSELGVKITIPDGYRERPDFAMGSPDVLGAFVEAEPYRSEDHVVIWIQRMRDVIDEGWIDVFTGAQGTQISTVRWRGTSLPVVKTVNTAGGLRRTQLNVQLPMTPEALLLGLVGPVERDEDLTDLVGELVSTVEGETNWLVDDGGLPSWVIAMLALIAGVGVGFLASRIR
jgi:hypothetical protein